MTPQEVFDRAVGGVLRQGRPAWLDGGDQGNGCVYRMHIGGIELRCAIGHVLTDDELARLEHAGHLTHTIRQILDAPEGEIEVPAVMLDHQRLVVALQNAHDVSVLSPPMGKSFLDQFKERARGVARAFRLDPGIIDRNGATT